MTLPATVELVPACGAMLAASDNIYVMLAMVIIAGISHWLQSRNKKSQEEQPWSMEDDAPPPLQRTAPPPLTSQPPPQSPQPQKEVDWEQELKRLLGEEPNPAPAPAAPPPLPPVIVRPVTSQRSTIDDEDEDALAAGAAKLGTLSESAKAHERVSSLQQGVEERFRRVDERTEKHTPEFGRSGPLPPARAVTLPVSPWRNRSAARQAIVASVIFGTPKGLSD